MTDLDILHDVYRSSYDDFKSGQGYGASDFLKGNIREFTQGVLEEWCGCSFLVSMGGGEVVNSEHDILFVASASHNARVSKGKVSYVPLKTRVALLSSGELVTFDQVTEKTGGTTWNGDDEYFETVSTKVTIKDTLAKSELFEENIKLTEISSEKIESVAVELSQLIIEIHEQEAFNV